MTRDPRWERVRGGVTREAGVVTITIEVRGKGDLIVGRSFRFTDDCLFIDPLTYVVDSIVRDLDEALHS